MTGPANKKEDAERNEVLGRMLKMPPKENKELKAVDASIPVRNQ